MSGRKARNTGRSRAGSALLKILSSVLALLFVVVVGLYGVMWVLTKGPSPTAKRIFTRSVKETSAVGFLANLYLSKAEIDEIIGSAVEDVETEELDTSLIVVKPPQPVYESSGESSHGEAEGNKKDGIELVEVSGSGYKGLMLIVDDPMRLFVGVPNVLGGVGMTLQDMVDTNDAVAGINAGGFYDPNGSGTGGTPDGLVVCDGKVVWGAEGVSVSAIGFDADGILHVSNMTPAQARDANLQWAVSFGPALIINGEPQSESVLKSGINPRTAIGQRADGAVLLLVVDGRQIDTLGATYGDLADIFLDFGAINAANLDGGSSTLMIYEGEIINSCASVMGPRPIPTSFLVR